MEPLLQLQINQTPIWRLKGVEINFPFWEEVDTSPSFFWGNNNSATSLQELRGIIGILRYLVILAGSTICIWEISTTWTPPERERGASFHRSRDLRDNRGWRTSWSPWVPCTMWGSSLIRSCCSGLWPVSFESLQELSPIHREITAPLMRVWLQLPYQLLQVSESCCYTLAFLFQVNQDQFPLPLYILTTLVSFYLALSSLVTNAFLGAEIQGS